MSEQELAPEEKRPTAAELKAQIEDKQRELKDEAKASVEPSAPDQPLAADVVTPDKPTETAGSSAVEAPAPVTDKADEVPEIVKKKGWRDVDSFLKSYAEMEKLASRKVVPTSEPPPIPQGYPPYQPPARSGVAEIAQRYNLDPGDLERVAPLIADLSESIADRKFKELQKLYDEDRRERLREKEIASLRSDPHFQNPEVLTEMGLVLESQPQLTKQEYGLTSAFNQALANVGRKRLEGSPEAPKPSGPVLPTKPPTTARGTGPTTIVGKPGIAAPQMNPAIFSGLPLAEKQKVLRNIGAIREE